MRAERRAGQILRETEKAKGGRPTKTGRATLPVPETLAAHGISKTQSSQWQRLAAIPQAEFEHVLKDAERPTTVGLIRATEEPKPRPVAAEALWLWGRLRDFERDGLLAKAPAGAQSADSIGNFYPFGDYRLRYGDHARHDIFAVELGGNKKTASWKSSIKTMTYKKHWRRE